MRSAKALKDAPGAWSTSRFVRLLMGSRRELVFATNAPAKTWGRAGNRSLVVNPSTTGVIITAVIEREHCRDERFQQEHVPVERAPVAAGQGGRSRVRPS